ncbi:MAG: hypothetical protein JJT77_12845 [Crocinitomicaceae bacterium]|nr:hypothetical protein [Crocinitomicaceae bacterium]
MMLKQADNYLLIRTDQAPGVMNANTSGTFNAGIGGQPACTTIDSIVILDPNFTTFTQCCQGEETLTPFFCGGTVDVDWWDDFQWTVED